MVSIVRNVTFFLLLFPLSAYSQIEVLPCGSIQFGEILVDPEGGRVSCGYTMENLDLHMDSGGRVVGRRNHRQGHHCPGQRFQRSPRWEI